MSGELLDGQLQEPYQPDNDNHHGNDTGKDRAVYKE